MKTTQLFNKAVTGAVLTMGLVLAGCTITDVTSSTSGTLDTVTPDVTLNHFVDTRMASIQKEAAQGEGEDLDALAELMGKTDKQAFSNWMHANYDELFSNLEKPSQLISRIETQSSGLI